MNKKVWLGGGVGVVVLLAAAVWFLFLRNDAPDVVTTAAGLEQLQTDLADVVPDTVVPDPVVPDPVVEDTVAPDSSVDGSWMIDDEFGAFDFDTASGSFAGFRVAEELTVGSATAVGRSGGVSGALAIDDGTLVAAEVTVDMTTIVSNEARRESAIRRAIGASEFPQAMFVLTEPVALETSALGLGETVAVEVVGDLTVKGTTNQVTFSLEATIAEPGVGLVIGSTTIIWEDFGVTPPSAPIVVSVADDGIIEFQLVVRQG